jgi:hypothetical protein
MNSSNPSVLVWGCNGAVHIRGNRFLAEGSGPVGANYYYLDLSDSRHGTVVEGNLFDGRRDNPTYYNIPQLPIIFRGDLDVVFANNIVRSECTAPGYPYSVWVCDGLVQHGSKQWNNFTSVGNIMNAGILYSPVRTYTESGNNYNAH